MLPFTAILIEGLQYGVITLLLLVACGQIVNFYYLVKPNLVKGKELSLFNNLSYLLVLILGTIWSYKLNQSGPIQVEVSSKLIGASIYCIPIIGSLIYVHYPNKKS
jgi:hypothetical protein